VLLCSDGLSNFASHNDIEAELSKFSPDTPKRLIDLANKGGGEDNITAVVLKY
jgi:protein phosphatase